MRLTALIATSVLFLLSRGACPAGDGVRSYLSADGKLVKALEIRDLQGGVVGFTGSTWTIEPSGKWTSGSVINAEVEVHEKGELTKVQLAKLAKELAKYDLASLPSEKGWENANPHVIAIKFGDRDVELIMKGGSRVPRAPVDGFGASVAGRYGGILAAVKAVAKTKKESS